MKIGYYSLLPYYCNLKNIWYDRTAKYDIKWIALVNSTWYKACCVRKEGKSLSFSARLHDIYVVYFIFLSPLGYFAP